jgi:hypothetical protein
MESPAPFACEYRLYIRFPPFRRYFTTPPPFRKEKRRLFPTFIPFHPFSAAV